MQTISLKIADNILMRIDDTMKKHNYTTRTEFIRDAIRDKLDQLESQKFEAEVRNYLNTSAKNEQVVPQAQVVINERDTRLQQAKDDIFAELERKFDRLREQLD